MKEEDEPPYDLRERTKLFGLRVVRMFVALPKTEEARVLGKQVLRSGTSVGANYREAHRSRSKAEFIARLGDCLNELDETAYWLELLTGAAIVPATKLSSLQDETDQLLAILTAISKKPGTDFEPNFIIHPSSFKIHNLFTFPPQTAFGKTVPKSRIYLHAAPSRRVKELFVSQVAEIVWAHKLAPETLRLPARPGVPEIQVFDLHLKTAALADDVLHAIDRAVPYPVIHRLHSGKGVAISAAFKRPSEADFSQWVVGSRFTTAFSKPKQGGLPLPPAIDLGHLYAALLAPLLPLPPRSGEDLPDHIARCESFLRLRRQIDQLTAKMRREKQFNRKVALNQQLKPLEAEILAIQQV